MSARAARIGCSVTLRAEFWSDLGGPEQRLRAEADRRLKTAGKNAEALAGGEGGGGLALLDEEGRPIGQEQPTRAEPAIVLTDAQPMTWRLVRNTFRKADTFQATFPLSLLPVHPSALRVVTCVVRLRAMTAAEWEAGTVRGERGPGGALRSQPSTGATDDDADFVGIAIDTGGKVSHDKVPSFSLQFQDYVGLLASKKVRPGLEFDESIPVSEAVAAFLRGSPAEGLKVVWTDTEPEPNFGRYRPVLHKAARTTTKARSVPKSRRPAQSKESYLDAIAHACGLVGAVPRVVGARLEIAYAGTMYEGRDNAGRFKETLLVTSIVENLEWKHALLGGKTRAVQVVSFDPDTHKQHTARWPPAAGKNAAASSSTGTVPAVPAVAANVGLPGFEQLDEAIDLVPVAPVADPSVLPRMAEALFLEKNRQRVQYDLVTHSPWANPMAPDDDGGRLLRLQAGDNVLFGVGVIAAGAGGRALAGVRAIAGELDEAGVRAELALSGVAPAVAAKVAAAIASTPKTDAFRVDEVDISDGDGAPEIRIGLVTYTAITLDLQRQARAPVGGAPATVEKARAAVAAAPTRADVKKAAQGARVEARVESTLPPEQEAALLRQIDQLEREALAGK
jgi:hypothetical protein